MSKLRSDIEPAKKWELLGALFGYLAVAKDVPGILALVGIGELCPKQVKIALLGIHNDPNRWYLVFFTGSLFFLMCWVLWSRAPSNEQVDDDPRSVIDRHYFRIRIIRVIRSLGLIYLRENILDKLKIKRYGTFRRPSEWAPEPNRSIFVDRISFIDGRGIEYQYSSKFDIVYVRTHSSDTDKFGESLEQEPSWADIKCLLIASNYFPFWICINFSLRLLRRIYTVFR